MTSPNDPGLPVTALLRAHVASDPDALDQLLPQVYDELRRIARRRLQRERADHRLRFWRPEPPGAQPHAARRARSAKP